MHISMMSAAAQCSEGSRSKTIGNYRSHMVYNTSHSRSYTPRGCIMTNFRSVCISDSEEARAKREANVWWQPKIGVYVSRSSRRPHKWKYVDLKNMSASSSR